MTNVYLLLATSLAVIYIGSTANTNRAKDDISFVDASDDASEARREKIKSEMDNYKRIKEMILKNKILSSSTTTEKLIEIVLTTEMSAAVAESTTESESVLTSTNELITAAQETSLTTSSLVNELTSTTEPSDESSSTTTELSTEKSSTIRHVELNTEKQEEEEETDDSIIEMNYDDTTNISEKGNATHPHLDDRFILNAPVICKEGEVKNHAGKCRKVV